MKSRLSAFIVSLFMIFSTVGVGLSCISSPIKISSLRITPDEVLLGQTVTIEATLSNTGKSAGILRAELHVDETLIETKEIELAAGEERVVIFTFIADTLGSHTINLNGLTDTFTVLRPASFDATFFYWYPRNPVAGQLVTVGAQISNYGMVSGDYEAKLIVNGEIIQTQVVSVEVNRSQIAEFTFTPDSPGLYFVEICDMSETIRVSSSE